MTYADQIAATVAAIRADVEELRDEYRFAFAEWARAVGNLKRWISDEARAWGIDPRMVVGSHHFRHWRYTELAKSISTLHALMVEARDRCEQAGDDLEWINAQESVEFDVENAEVPK
jgi:hypothetical protein